MGASQLSEVSRSPNLQISNAIHQFLDVGGGGSGISVQILNNALGGCKLAITKVGNQWGEEVRRCGDFAADYGRGSEQSQRYEFCKQVWAGARNYMAEEIEHIGPTARQELIGVLRFTCGLFRDDVGRD